MTCSTAGYMRRSTPGQHEGTVTDRHIDEHEFDDEREDRSVSL